MHIVLCEVTQGDGCHGIMTPGLVQTAEQATDVCSSENMHGNVHKHGQKTTIDKE